MAIYTQLLKKQLGSQLTEEGASFMKVIVDGAQRIARLVSDLLAFAHVSSIDLGELRAIEADPVLDQVLIDLEQAALESRAEITRDPLPSVSLQEVHLQQLFQNLIGNALKYRRDDQAPRVHVKTTALAFPRSIANGSSEFLSVSIRMRENTSARASV